jgi:spoIIIJ-associated protein
MSHNEDWVPEQDQEHPSSNEGSESNATPSQGAGGGGGRSPRGSSRRPEPYEPPDERSRRALEFVQDVIEDMGMECEALLRKPPEENPDEIVVEIVGKDSGRIIGKKGQVLQALQFLAHRVINRPGQERRHILVDAEGYRSRRDDNLATMARRLGKQAVELGKIITFEPMNPRDRRVVHMALAKFEGVITKSDGEGDDRRVQIIPVRR